MSRLLDDDNDLLEQRDRELTLSTGAILAIFLGLVLLCAVFFGFGYNLGRKSTTPATSEPAAEPSTTQPASAFDNFKPSPSSPAAATSAPATTAPTGPPAIDLPPSPSASSVTVPASPTPKPAAEAPKPTSNTAVQPVAKAAPPVPPPPAPRKPAVTTPPASAAAHTAPPPAAAPASSTPAITPNGAFIVQVAAVSRQDDADLLVTALRAKGYQVAARLSPQDKLIHIQVGPYATRRDAEAMREKLIMDGYNAIVK